MYERATKGYCVACDTVVPASVREESGSLVFHLECPRCGESTSVAEHDASLYRHWETIRRPNRPPESHQTERQEGCPFDCGLCGNHRQKSCITLVEITSACDLGCPVCFADAGTGRHRSLAEIEAMFDACVRAANGKPDILQISGGEPACHPQLIEILRAAKSRPFKHIMLNTNGLAIAEGRLECAQLKSLGNAFEVHLQFDGLTDAVYEVLRGRPLLALKQKALERLASHEIPVTLVATLRGGLNTAQLGDLLRFSLSHPAVRGLNLQCEARFGRTTETWAPSERVTQTLLVREITRQAPDLLRPEDFLPLSCGLASLAYLEKVDGVWKPIPPGLAEFVQGNPMTITLEELQGLAESLCECRRAALLQALAERLPKDLLERSIADRSRLVHERFFHITIVSFLDAWNFDLDRACRECTHIAMPDGGKIPFSAFNTRYRKRCTAHD